MAKEKNNGPGLETYQNHLGYTLGYQLHLPTRNAPEGKKPPVLVYLPGYGGSMSSKYVTCSMDDVLDSGIAVVRFDTTPVERDADFNTVKTDTSMLTPSYYVQTVHAALKHTVKTYGAGGKDLIDTDNIGINAASYGARNGLYYAAHMNGLQKRILDEEPVPVKGIILQAPVLSLAPFNRAILVDRWLSRVSRHKSWKQKGVINVPIAGYLQDVPYGVYEEFNAVDIFKDVAPHVTCPVKMIYGTRDNLSGAEQIKMLEKSLTQVVPSRKEKCEIKNVGHFFQNMKDVAKLNGLSEEALRALVKQARKEDKKDNLIARYIEENFRDITCLGTVIDESRRFLKEKVFVPPSDKNGGPHLAAA